MCGTDADADFDFDYNYRNRNRNYHQQYAASLDVPPRMTGVVKTSD
jgi:hypothetical protein